MIGMTSYAVLGFSGGGKTKAIADVPIYFAIDDMQIAEDAQLRGGPHGDAVAVRAAWRTRRAPSPR